MMNFFKKTLPILIVILLSLTHVYPYMVKGYGPASMDSQMLLAKNYSNTGEFVLENDHYVVLNTHMVDQGVQSSVGNRLTSFIYSWGFDSAVFVNFLVYLFAAIVVVIVGNRLFSPPVGYIAGGVFSLFPVITKASLIYGFYEFAVLFFLIGLLLLVRKKVSSWQLFIIAALFVLSVLARNAMLLSTLPLLIGVFLFAKRKIVPALSILFFFLLFLVGQLLLYPGTSNSYISTKHDSFERLGHLFPDPYVYLYESEEFIAETADELSNLNTIEFLGYFGEDLSLLQHLKVYSGSIMFYIKDFFTESTFGGPLIAFGIIFGVFMVFRKKPCSVVYGKYFITWMVLWFSGLVILKTNNWDHFIEISILAALFLGYLLHFIYRKILSFDLFSKTLRHICIVLLFGTLFAHFVYANQNVLADEYSSGIVEEVFSIKDSVVNSTSPTDIVLVGTHVTEPPTFTYYTNRSSIYFAEETVETLLEENILSEVFDDFGITAVTHYSEDVLSRIEDYDPSLIIIY